MYVRIGGYMYLLPAGKDQRAKAQETVSKGESAFFFFFLSSWSILHIGNYTARTAAKGSAKRKEEHLKQERNNSLARRAV